MELSKSKKKIAREIIVKGLQNEFAKGLSDADKILSAWKNFQSDNRDTYHVLYKHITDFDKHIAMRYDGMTGSRYLLVILRQLQDGMISEKDLENFPIELQQWLKGATD